MSLDCPGCARLTAERDAATIAHANSEVALAAAIAEARTLQSERDAARYLRAGYGRLARVARREHERALAERDAARDALARFGEHDLDCGVHPDPPRALDGPCTCGLSAALRGPSR